MIFIKLYKIQNKTFLFFLSFLYFIFLSFSFYLFLFFFFCKITEKGGVVGEPWLPITFEKGGVVGEPWFPITFRN